MKHLSDLLRGLRGYSDANRPAEPAGRRHEEEDVDGLVEFLRARLDEDDAEARRVPPNQSPTELRAMVTREGSEPFLVIASERVLREVDAKRRIVERFAWLCEHGDTGGTAWVLPLLARPYADRPGYREEWRP
ncbi:DUF6221 family protein [Streptomyces antimycoticus]|uniref:DUF6221 family protein n=1 Tax=Streptomyces antimycoticus TaxID=68175 RepID=UPI0036E6805A